jgi:DNA-binding transcriptional LysR family regulator
MSRAEVLDSWQLRVFVTLARCRSFAQAARELHLTPSALSHSLKSLEEQLGCRLLDRRGKKLSLTLPGEELLQHATKILAQMAAAREAIQGLTQWGRGRLRLMASPTACQYIIPPVLREFRSMFPEYSITVEPGNTPAAVAALWDQRIDLALGLRPPPPMTAEFRPLFHDTLVFIVGATHPWALRRRAERSEIARQSFILYSKNSLTFRLTEQYFSREGILLPSVIEVGSLEASKELVKLGLGVSIMAPWVARKELEDGALVALPLGRRPLIRQWGVLYPRGKTLSLAEDTFVRICTSVTQSLNSELLQGLPKTISEARNDTTTTPLS